MMRVTVSNSLASYFTKLRYCQSRSLQLRLHGRLFSLTTVTASLDCPIFDSISAPTSHIHPYWLPWLTNLKKSVANDLLAQVRGLIDGYTVVITCHNNRFDHNVSSTLISF